MSTKLKDPVDIISVQDQFLTHHIVAVSVILITEAVGLLQSLSGTLNSSLYGR